MDFQIFFGRLPLQFQIIQNVLFHINTHLDFCHTMSASAPAVSGRNCRQMALQTSYQKYESTLQYNSQFCVSFHYCFLQEAQKHHWACLNGAKKLFSSFQICIGMSSYKQLVQFPTFACWKTMKGNPISTFQPCYSFHIGEVIQIWLARLMG